MSSKEDDGTEQPGAEQKEPLDPLAQLKALAEADAKAKGANARRGAAEEKVVEAKDEQGVGGLEALLSEIDDTVKKLVLSAAGFGGLAAATAALHIALIPGLALAAAVATATPAIALTVRGPGLGKDVLALRRANKIGEGNKGWNQEYIPMEAKVDELSLRNQK